MAIFGDLQHLPFTELSRVLGTQTGTLVMEQAMGGRSAELHLHGGALRALFVDGFPVRDAPLVQRAVRQLAAEGTGPFEFQPCELHDLNTDHRLPLSDLLRAGVSDQSVPEELLPHADTRFVATAQRQPAPKTLWSAWALIEPLLGEGASASELARRLDLDERQMRQMLYGLRGADLIAPVRASAQAPSASRPAPGPVQRFLGALRRLTGARA